jgi:signal transduction histidine kinase
VLLVEEDVAYADFLRSLFADRPAIALTHAESPAVALAQLRSRAFDVVLLSVPVDANRVAAFELMGELKHGQEGPPVIVVADSWDEALAVQAIHAGADDYLLKSDPDPRTVARTIRYAIERARAREHLRQAGSALRERDEQLRQSQKLEAMGRLAGGIAHDFSNLLTVIVGASDRLLEGLPEAGSLRRDAESVKTSAERAVNLTRQILAFSRQQATLPTALNLNDVLVSLERFLRPLIGEDIRLEMICAPDLGLVRADRTQIEQIFLNLVVNARDATPAGGRVTIETRNATIDGTAEGVALDPGAYVVVSVTDSGHGMDAATKSQAFEPFFTTKAVGQGTGLGLSIVYGIVTQSGGALKILSEPAAGTSVVVYLPRMADSAPLPIDQSERQRVVAPAGGDETVLVVEDEDGVRELVRDMLGMAGYHVLDAPRPTIAEQICREFDGAIHLLLTDVVMPDMGGRELAERVKAMRPDTKVLFMSGYPEHAALPGGSPTPDMPLVPKPFNRRALLQHVRNVLDS